MKYISKTVFVLFFVTASFAQSPKGEHPGVQLYLQGNYAEAVKILSLAVKDKYWKSDPALWNYLGLAYISTSDYKKAKKATQTAIDLAPENSIYHTNLSYLYLVTRDFNKALKEADRALGLDGKNVHARYIRGSAYLLTGKLDEAEKDSDLIMTTDPSDPSGYVLKSSVQMSLLGRSLLADPNATSKNKISYLEDAYKALEIGAERAKLNPNRKMIDDELAMIGAFYKHYKKEPKDPAIPDGSIVTPIKILFKPRASYTDKARELGIEGKIRVAVLLRADGKVQYILFLKRLGAGLDEEALKAAKQIKFEPKKVNGQPVSTVLTFEYGFDIY